MLIRVIANFTTTLKRAGIASDTLDIRFAAIRIRTVHVAHGTDERKIFVYVGQFARIPATVILIYYIFLYLILLSFLIFILVNCAIFMKLSRRCIVRNGSVPLRVRF